MEAASNTPAAPPANEMRMLSVRSCLTSRARLAPTASRTAISLTTLGGAREQQIGQVHTRKQEHQRADHRQDTGKSENRILNVRNEQTLAGPGVMPRPTFSG